jgi:8-oxo-dGTP diphosphatase
MCPGPMQVAAGVIRRGGEVLLSRRPAHKPHGGLWEFPGGKLQAGESAEQALQRELMEELGIHVDRVRTLTSIHHRYPAFDIQLWACDVLEYRGVPCGREGQELCWVPLADLGRYQFPEANLAIIEALQAGAF